MSAEKQSRKGNDMNFQENPNTEPSRRMFLGQAVRSVGATAAASLLAGNIAGNQAGLLEAAESHLPPRTSRPRPSM